MTEIALTALMITFICIAVVVEATALAALVALVATLWRELGKK